jgi:hypothetical protein
VTPSALAYRRKQRSPDEVRERRVAVVWALLFFNVLQSPSGGLLPIPHRVAQVLTQGALVGALVVALTINPKCRIRPCGLFLALYSLLAVTSLMMSIRFVSVGTAYRATRLILFLAVLWLLTPWWGSRKIVLRSHIRFLGFIFASVVIGLVISPHKALPGHRLSGSIWPIPATQVAHYTAELLGLTLILWLCRMVSRRRMLLVVLPGVAAVIGTHTRTAFVAGIAGLLAAGLSLFAGSRRVRRAFAIVIAAIMLIGLPLSSLVSSWAARGENSSQISDLTGRTKAWALVYSEPRPETNKILGSGLSNGSITGQPNPALDGLSIDSGWILTYQDQGIVGDVLEAAMFLVLLVTALLRPRGPRRAMALFLIIYCFVASFTESGMGNASAYILDLTVAASLLAETHIGVSGGPSPALLGRES